MWDQDKNEEPGMVPNQYNCPEIECHRINQEEIHHHSHISQVKYQYQNKHHPTQSLKYLPMMQKAWLYTHSTKVTHKNFNET